jgi:hypothetical protein
MGSATEIAPGLRRWAARNEEWDDDVGAGTHDGLSGGREAPACVLA